MRKAVGKAIVAMVTGSLVCGVARVVTLMNGVAMPARSFLDRQDVHDDVLATLTVIHPAGALLLALNELSRPSRQRGSSA